MSETIHLFEGADNGDGTVTVGSVISLCCKTAFPTGRGTVTPGDETCSADVEVGSHDA